MTNAFGVEKRTMGEKKTGTATPVDFIDGVTESDIAELRRDLAADLRARMNEYTLVVSITPDEARFIIEELEK